MADARVRDFPRTVGALNFVSDWIFTDRDAETDAGKCRPDVFFSPVTLPHSAQTSGYVILSSDNANGVQGRKIMLSGTTNTINVNTGLGAYNAASPLLFVVTNNASGNCTVSGTATLNTPNSVPAAIVPYGTAVLEQVATDSYILSGDLTPS